MKRVGVVLLACLLAACGKQEASDPNAVKEVSVASGDIDAFLDCSKIAARPTHPAVSPAETTIVTTQIKAYGALLSEINNVLIRGPQLGPLGTHLQGQITRGECAVENYPAQKISGERCAVNYSKTTTALKSPDGKAIGHESQMELKIVSKDFINQGIERIVETRRSMKRETPSATAVRGSTKGTLTNLRGIEVPYEANKQSCGVLSGREIEGRRQKNSITTEERLFMDYGTFPVEYLFTYTRDARSDMQKFSLSLNNVDFAALSSGPYTDADRPTFDFDFANVNFAPEVEPIRTDYYPFLEN